MEWHPALMVLYGEAKQEPCTESELKCQCAQHSIPVSTTGISPNLQYENSQKNGRECFWLQQSSCCSFVGRCQPSSCHCTAAPQTAHSIHAAHTVLTIASHSLKKTFSYVPVSCRGLVLNHESSFHSTPLTQISISCKHLFSRQQCSACFVDREWNELCYQDL